MSLTLLSTGVHDACTVGISGFSSSITVKLTYVKVKVFVEELPYAFCSFVEARVGCLQTLQEGVAEANQMAIWSNQRF